MEIHNKTPFVSIALATYNGQKYLREFLDSVYAQSYPNIEVIAVDDCSTDDTVKILEEYRVSNGLKFYRNNQNLGFVKNFEKALSLCKGDFIALADQDDIWFSNKIKILVKDIGENLLIHSDAALLDAENKVIADSFTKFSKKQVQLKNFHHLLFYNNVTGCTALINRKLLEIALPFPDKILYHDWWLALAAAKSGTIAYTDEKLLYYRQHSNVSGGAEIMALEQLVGHSLVKGFMKDRMEKNTKLLNWYTAILSFYNFESEKEKKIVRDMIDYHRSFFMKRMRFKAFLIHVRYFGYLYPHYRFYTRIFILLTSLIGLGKRSR